MFKQHGDPFGLGCSFRLNFFSLDALATCCILLRSHLPLSSTTGVVVEVWGCSISSTIDYYTRKWLYTP